MTENEKAVKAEEIGVELFNLLNEQSFVVKIKGNKIILKFTYDDYLFFDRIKDALEELRDVPN
jgi:hypothetical protein